MQNPLREQSNINPQRENGHREIENNVFQALIRARLSGGEYQVVLYILDRTWGWDKASAIISLSQYTKATRLSKQGVIDAIHSLKRKSVICVLRNGTKGTEYLFNKHYDTWDTPQASQAELTSQPDQLVTEPEPQLVNQSVQADAREESLVKQSVQAEGEALVKQGVQGLPSRVDMASKAELTSACQVPEASTTPAIESIKETPKESIKEIYTIIFDHWNSLSIITHKKMVDKRKAAVKTALEDYSKEEICQAMRNYAEILQGEEYFWKYKWTLEEFVRRGLEKFMDIQVARDNYRIDQGGLDGRRKKPRGDAQGIGRTTGYSAEELRRGLRGRA